MCIKKAREHIYTFSPFGDVNNITFMTPAKYRNMTRLIAVEI